MNFKKIADTSFKYALKNKFRLNRKTPVPESLF